MIPWWADPRHYRRTYLRNQHDPEWMYVFCLFRIVVFCGLAMLIVTLASAVRHR